MTKVVKFWKRFSFWAKVRIMLIPVTIGGEVALYFGDSHGFWKIATPIATMIVYALTHLIKDENKDDIIDGLEEKP